MVFSSFISLITGTENRVINLKIEMIKLQYA